MKKSIIILILLFWITGVRAQLVQKSGPDFEVSASLHPWDVHDEGINVMLDNLTGMSGVNSDGQGIINFSVGGKQKSSWKLNEDTDCWKVKTIRNVKIKKGDEILITGIANGKECARVDYIDFLSINQKH